MRDSDMLADCGCEGRKLCAELLLMLFEVGNKQYRPLVVMRSLRERLIYRMKSTGLGSSLRRKVQIVRTYYDTAVGASPEVLAFRGTKLLKPTTQFDYSTVKMLTKLLSSGQDRDKEDLIESAARFTVEGKSL